MRKQLADFDSRLAMLLEFPRRLQQVSRLGPLQLRFFKRQRLAVVLRQARFGIESIDIRRPAGHEKENDPLGFGWIVPRPHRHPTSPPPPPTPTLPQHPHHPSP